MTWASLHWNALDPDQQRELATAALTAALPFIAAKAKAEALREAAAAMSVTFPYATEQGIFLRARATTIESEATNV